MGIALAQAFLPNVSGIVEDGYVNTFHFETPGADVSGGDAAQIVTAVAEFYVDVRTTDAVGQYLGESISRVASACQVKVYDLGQAEPRVPIDIGSFTMPAPASGDELPSEVALCLSYKGQIIAGDVPARHRGRIYIGPLTTGAASFATTPCRPLGALQTDLLDAAEALQDAATLGGFAWVVYSRVDAAPYIINDAWVDNAFDTQRRRGAPPTSRATRSIFP